MWEEVWWEGVCVLQVLVDHGKASGFYSKCNGTPAEGFDRGVTRSDFSF